MRRTGLLAVVLVALLAAPAPGGAGKREPARVRLAFAGDILFDRGVRDAIARGGVDALFADAAPVLSGADFAVANLECPLTRRGLRSAKPFSFRGDPEAAGALERAGLDAVTLANNHTLDYGRGALGDTVAALGAAGVAAVGAGPTRADALRPLVVERGGLRVALLGYCDLFIESVTPRADAPGVATGDRDALVAAIRAARDEADVVVVLLHWGVEYRPRPTETQRDLARRCVAAGATLVVGAHPHVLQPVERVGASLVAYSLGNFVFDQTRQDGCDTAVLVVTVGADGVVGYEAVPFVVSGCRPRRASGADAERIARRLAPL